MPDQRERVFDAHQALDEPTGRQPALRRARVTGRPRAAVAATPRPRRLPAWATRKGFRLRHGAAAFGMLMLLVLFVSVSLSPSTSSGFLASITNGTDSAGTRSNFTPSGGALPYVDAFPGTTTGNVGGEAGWIELGGNWNTDATGVYRDTTTNGSGDKTVTGQPTWGDYTLQADVRIDSGSQAGLVFRVNNPTVGTDALNGYYFGLYPGALGTGLGGKVELGRQNNNYTSLKSTSTTLITAGSWYHVTVQAIGCTFTTSFVAVGSTATPTSATTTDAGCPTTGAIGLRDLNTSASFRNVTVTPGGVSAVTPATYYAPFATSASGWTSSSGTFVNTTSSETYNDTSGSSGDKALQTTSWGNATLVGDVQIVGTAAGNAGFLVHVSSATSAAFNFIGYYAAVSGTSLSVIRGNGASAPTTLVTTPLPTALPVGTWYHLTVEAVAGCKITVTGQLKTGGVQTVATVTDPACTTALQSGQSGVMASGTTASWRFVSVTPR